VYHVNFAADGEYTFKTHAHLAQSMRFHAADLVGETIRKRLCERPALASCA
jgi:hypothetical protein